MESIDDKILQGIKAQASKDITLQIDHDFENTSVLQHEQSSIMSLASFSFKDSMAKVTAM